MNSQLLKVERPVTILVADDEPDNLTLMKILLESEGYHVVTVENGQEAVDQANAGPPDLVILDVMMPVMDGLEACRQIKNTVSDVPVIFLSAHDKTEVQVSGFSLGANDFIAKPFNGKELLARVDVAIRLKQERDILRASAAEAHINAEIAQERAMTDALTGLLNRYGLQRSLRHERSEAHRYSRPLSCLMIDMDHFKSVNDSHGHVAGDKALQQMAEILTGTVRGADLVFRYGGEEFLVLLPETDLEGASLLAEKIREAVSIHKFGGKERAFFMTLSIGAARLCDEESGNDMIARADMALYQAKELGRNRVEHADCG